MKIRNGFVSNSSTSSFFINLSDLNYYQVAAIQNHLEVSKTLSRLDASFEECNENDVWHINIDNDKINGYTDLDNFDMRAFLEAIGVKEEIIKWCE